MWRASWAAVLAVVLGLTFVDAKGANGQGAAVGRVVAAKGDETVQAAGAAGARPLQVGQSIAAGDVVKTGPYGSAAILLRDDTQIRIHRQSTFEIGQVRGAGGELSKFRLLTGSAWSRAKALLRAVTGEMGIGRQAVEMSTPTATIGIRGTDWYVSVGENGRTDVIVLAGEVDLANELGAIKVGSGEQGTVERGKPPTKRTVVDLRNRPLIVMETELEWFDMLTIGGRRSAELGWAREQLEQTVAAGPRAAPLVDLAAVAYDQGDYAAAAAAIERASGANPSAHDRARAQLVQGLLDVRRRDLDAAGRALDAAAANLAGREKVIAELGRAGVDVERRRYAEAEAKVRRHDGEATRYPEVKLFQSWLASFAGRHEEALGIARDGEASFAHDPRFPALYAYVAFLLGQPGEMKAGIDRALAIDPEMPFAWYVQGLYHHYAEPDAAAARAAYARAVKSNPNHTASWNNLALVDFDRGDYKATQIAMQEALRSDPRSPITKSNYGFILAFLDRLDDAEAQFREASRLDPAQPYSQVGLGFLDLFRGDPDSAAGEFLAAGAIDPELPGVNRNLAAAYYQTGRFEDAKKELDTARRFDPDDPIPDVMGSIMAVDQYEAGEAIRYAREGFQKTLRSESFAVETLANARSGSATLGNAYTNLGLYEWGGYYTLLAFDPYLANGYFYLSQDNQFASEDARLGSNRQGLLLDPTAISFPTRYYEPFRQPRNDLSAGATIGSNGGAANYTARATSQGYLRTPNPLAYYVSGSRTDDDGYRDNADFTNESVFIGLGSTLDERKHNLLFILDAQRFDNGTRDTDNDRDDRALDEFIFASLGYQHRFSFDNRLMVRVFGGTEHGEGRTYNNLDFPIDPNFTCTLPCNSEVDTENTYFQFQLRHLLDIGPVEFTWGAEWYDANGSTNINTVAFTGFGPAFFTELSSRDVSAQTLYVRGRWRINPDLWLDAGAFGRRLEVKDVDPDLFGTRFTGSTEEEQIDPRLGLAWRVTDSHWLRAAAQRKLLFPQRASETLAPVDTVGFVVEDQFFTFFEGGPSVDDYQVRWEAEWTPRFFTFAGYGHSELQDFSRSGFDYEEGEIDIARVGTNIWLGERWGLRGQYLRLWSEDPADGLDLPLIQESQADLSLTWVHPRHVRASVFASYVGERWDDPLNTVRLDGYWLTGITATWEPMRKHWYFNVTVSDLLDEQPEFTGGFPTPGRSVFLSAEYRFGNDAVDRETTGAPAFTETGPLDAYAGGGAAAAVTGSGAGGDDGRWSLVGRTARTEFGIDLSAGYREDSLDWNIASDPSGTATPNILSELTWEDLQIAMFRADAWAAFRPGLYLTGMFAYGGIVDGENRDSDYAGDDRTGEFSRSLAQTEDDEVRDASGGVGWRLRIYDTPAAGRGYLIPLAGYSHHVQSLRDTDAIQVVGGSGPIPGLDSTYEAEWNGPWVGMRASMELPRNLQFFATGEYHWADVHGEANWNLREAFVHPRSFEQDADANGWVVSVGADWFPGLLNRRGTTREGGRWYLQARGTWQDWSADAGTDRVYFSDGTSVDTRLNEVNWSSWSATLGIGLRF